jgi:glycosyltransferase involved in cell wall biosynthesis
MAHFFGVRMVAEEIGYSFLIPTAGRGERLQATLRSLEAVEVPTRPFEVVIVFDGRIPALLKGLLDERRSALRLVVLEQPHAGPASARNRAASHARGEWFVFLDDDCSLSPDFLRVLEPALEPGARLAIGGQPRTPTRAEIWSEASHIVVQAFVESRRDAAGVFHFLPSQNLILHRTAWQAIGGFDTAFNTAAGEDREFCARWRATGGTLVRLPQLRYVHDDPLGFKKFLRKHRQYGEGAVRVWRKSTTPRWSNFVAFFVEAARQIVCVRPRRRIPLVAAAVLLSQTATLFGICRACAAHGFSRRASRAVRAA